MLGSIQTLPSQLARMNPRFLGTARKKQEVKDTYLNSYPSLSEGFLTQNQISHAWEKDMKFQGSSDPSVALHVPNELHPWMRSGKERFCHMRFCVTCKGRYTATREEPGDNKSRVSATPTTTASGSATRAPRHHCNTHKICTPGN